MADADADQRYRCRSSSSDDYAGVMMRTSYVALAVLTALALAPLAGAQDLRTLQTSRQLTDTEPLQVDVTFAAGKFSLHPIDGTLLYQMRLKYDERATDAVHEYDADDHRLTVGVNRGTESFGVRALRGGSHQGSSEMELGLNRAVPMELNVKVAGTESRLELGGLRLTGLEVHCAASGATVSFGSPNRVEMETFTMHIAGAGAKIENLGNANAANVMLKGAAGGMDIDFGSDVLRDVTINAELAVGGLQITLPRGVGIMVRAKSKLGGFDGAGLNKVGDAWYSENWNQAGRKVTIESTTVLGNLELTRTGH
jgi:hypothetical protein